MDRVHILRSLAIALLMMSSPAELPALDSLQVHAYTEVDLRTEYQGEILSIQKRTEEAPGAWFYFVSCAMFLLLVIKFTVFRNFTRRSWDAWVNENIFYQLTREKSPVHMGIAIVEGALKVFIVASMMLLAAGLLRPGFELSPQIMTITSLVVALFFTARYLAALGISMLTDKRELFHTAFLNGMVIMSNAAWILVPLIFVVVYLPAPFSRYGSLAAFAVLLLVILVLLVRVFRIVLREHHLFNLQFFLYLCAFEILPYLLLVKVIESNVVE